MKFISKFFLGINVLIVLATIGSYLSPFVNPTKTVLLSYFGLAYPFLFLLNLIAILAWLFIKPKNAILSLATLVIGGNAICNYIGINSADEKSNETHLTIATFNTQSAYAARGNNPKEYAENSKVYKKFLQNFNHVDILCVQEHGFYGDKLISETLDFKDDFVLGEHATRIYSKYPIIAKGDLGFGGIANNCIWVDIKKGGNIIRVYNAHLESNRISDAADQVMKNASFEKETILGIKGIFNGYAKYAKSRAHQAKIIKDHISKCDHPFILAGDFNDTPQSYTYRLISKNLKDGFRESGGGFGSTFGGSLPGLRIDYILTDQNFEHLSYSKLNQKFSDHYPVISQVKLE